MKNDLDIFRNETILSTYSSLENTAVEKIMIDDYVLLEKIGQGGDNFDKSKEILGHSILEISGGVIIGIICSLLIV